MSKLTGQTPGNEQRAPGCLAAAAATGGESAGGIAAKETAFSLRPLRPLPETVSPPVPSSPVLGMDVDVPIPPQRLL